MIRENATRKKRSRKLGTSFDYNRQKPKIHHTIRFFLVNYASHYANIKNALTNTLTFTPQFFTTAEFFHIKDYYFTI